LISNAKANLIGSIILDEDRHAGLPSDDICLRGGGIAHLVEEVPDLVAGLSDCGAQLLNEGH